MPILEISGKRVEFASMPSPDEIDEVAKSFAPKPMFSTEAEGRAASKQAEDYRKQAAFEASPIGFPVTQGLSVVNRAINTATGNLPEIAANLAGQTTRPITESDISKSVGEAAGFIAPTGAPMRAIKAMEGINNPLTRNIAQGAAAMATQLPTSDRGASEYATGIGLGAASGVLGRGAEKVAEGAIQQSAKSLSGRIGDYLAKLPTKAFRFSKDPLDVLSKEADGLVSNSIGEYADNAGKLLEVRNKQLDGAVAGSTKKIDILDQIKAHIAEARSHLNGSFIDQQPKIQKLAELEQSLIDLSQSKSFKDLPIQDAIRIKRQLAKDFPFNEENSNDVVANAAHKMYWEINKAVEVADPSIAELNHRVSGLIDIENAARNRLAVESRNNPLGMVARLGAMGAAGVGIGSGHSVEGIISALGIMGVEKAIQSPAVLSRVAKALSAMSMEERLKVVAQFPKLKSVIKVDSRDVEIITPQPKNNHVGRAIPKRGETIDVQGKVIYPKIENQSVKKIGYTPEYIQSRGKDIPRKMRLSDQRTNPDIIKLGENPTAIAQEGVSTPRRPEAIEEGEYIVPVKKTPIPSIKGKSGVTGAVKGRTPIPSMLKNKKGELRISSGEKNPQDFATAEEYVASKILPRNEKRKAISEWKKSSGIKDVDSSFKRGAQDESIHSPASPESGSPLYDVTQNGTYPEDVYSSNGLRYYATGEDALDRQAYSIIEATEGFPSKQIRIYRAVEKDGSSKIIPGDWVTTVRQYAKEHGDASISGGYKIVSKVVTAKDLYTAGDSWLEFGYHPQPMIPSNIYRLSNKSQLTAEWQAAQGKNIKKSTPIKRKGE